ncbi:MAG: hypothetical protein KAJ46_00065, partial [Sedimentisphaerales bacterium]|nr:hypothetical protein [Sedimentisphaerales bacterium]
MNRFYKYVVVLVLVLMVGQCRVFAVDKAVVTSSNEKKTTVVEKKDPDRVLVTVNGVSFKGWQADAMIKYGASRSLPKAIELWVDI